MAAGAPDFEIKHVYPVVDATDAALRAGDWPGVRAAFAAAGSAYEQHAAIAAAGSVPGCENLLAVIAGRDPADLLARTMLAWRQLVLGWEIRGEGRAATVSQQQFEGCFAHLELAEQTLIEVCARDPENLGAWGVRLFTSRGLGLGASETRRRYQRVAALAPHDLIAQEALLQDLLPKWGGGWEQAIPFAWECAEQAPPGSPNAGLVVALHIERWVDSSAELKAVFADPAVRRDVWRAGELSVMNPAFTGAPGWEYALSAFALGYSLIEDWPRAKSCFARLGPFAHDTGWSYFDNPAKTFLEWRTKAMAA